MRTPFERDAVKAEGYLLALWLLGAVYSPINAPVEQSSTDPFLGSAALKVDRYIHSGFKNYGLRTQV